MGSLINSVVGLGLFATVFFTIGCSSLRPSESSKLREPVTELACPASREYAATFHFLDSNKAAYGLGREEVHQISHNVSRGCKGAAARFISVYNILIKVGLGGRSAVRTGVALANRTDEYAKAFTDIFLQAYLEDKLNLDIHSSFEIAKSLSLEFAGKPKQAVEDFSKFTHFCLNDPAVNADLTTCAKLASSTIKKTERYSQSAFKEFKEIFYFIKEKSSLKLNTAEALALSQEVVMSGPLASENFRLAYEFGLAGKGLDYDAKAALSFARQMIKVAQESQHKDRMPASKGHSQP